jgi:hypothetical protein
MTALNDIPGCYFVSSVLLAVAANHEAGLLVLLATMYYRVPIVRYAAIASGT